MSSACEEVIIQITPKVFFLFGIHGYLERTHSRYTNQLRSSEKLKVIMKTILYMGNTLNQGTPRGTEYLIIDVESPG